MDKYKDPDVLSKVNKSDMAGMMETIQKYLRLCCGVVRALLKYVTRETIIGQIYGDYSKYATLDNKMIAMALHLSLDKNKLNNKKVLSQSRNIWPEYEIKNRSVYEILDKICKDTNLYPYVKQNKFKWDERGHFIPSTPGG